MGHTSAVDMVAEAGVEGALEWHLRCNHYPPVPLSVLPVAVRVIAAANAGLWDAKVQLPKGVTYRGEQAAPVSACVTAWHLDAFLSPEEGEDYGD